MTSFPVDTLEPKALWAYFDKICAIPHGSSNEAALGEAIMKWVKEKGCETERDEKGNVVVRVPATAGYENAPTIVIQGHIDMVCEKNSDKEFDFEKDSIALQRDGDWITADGTTLGADNGIGVAAGLAFLDMPDFAHGPLEILCTVEEEIGLFGAVALQPGFVEGRLLLNLDSEEDGIFYVGCAGGRDSHLTLPIERQAATGGKSAFKVQIKGLRGGHSGLDIIHNRGNAVKLLGRALRTVGKEVEFELGAFGGGDKHNAIPRESEAVVLVDGAQRRRLEEILATELEAYRTEFASHEPDLALTVEQAEAPSEVLEPASAASLMQLALGIPHGVLAMVRDMDGMVDTSTNMARVRVEGDTVTVLCSTRSSNASSIDGVLAQIEAVGLAVGAAVEFDEGYPGWQPNMESEMLANARRLWKEVHGEEAKFEVIHAGLECGIIGERYPGMDMISIGPTIQNPHSPEERVSISTVERLFEFVKAVVAHYAKV